MKINRPVSYLIVSLTMLLCHLYIPESYAQKNSGVFYTTILAKTGPYSRIKHFGTNASAYFMQDVNGDGKDDAVAYYASGSCKVAISDGTNFIETKDSLSFQEPVSNSKPMMGDVNGDGKSDLILYDPDNGNWNVSLSAGLSFLPPRLWIAEKWARSANQLLADVNGDGKADAIVFSQTDVTSQWHVALSNGKGFGKFSVWLTGFGKLADQILMGDVDGDGKADAILYTKSNGNWDVAISEGSKFKIKGNWKTGFGVNADTGIIYDVDRDGKSDIVYYNKAGWWVSYASGKGFSTNDQQWISSHRPATMNSRGNKPEPQAKLVGNISGHGAGACVVSDGEWLYLENPNKQATVDAVETDTWVGWGNQYIPQVPGHEGTYDAGDSVVLDRQIKMIHDAGFTYLMLDITNGNHPWIDGRAKKLMNRLRNWNDNLKAGQHKMYYCISMGGSRGLTGSKALDACESESKRTWTEFYELYPEGYYLLDGKPLLIHFVWDVNNSTEIKSLSASMPYFKKFTVRWMYNEIKNSPDYANAYGWPILKKFGNPEGNEVMDVSPGFWNGAVGVSREQGELYRSHWMRVLQFNPQSIWLNSFNETWEHTSVEPAYLPEEVSKAFPQYLSTWTDYQGKRMDDFYWVMTKQYNRLYMYNELFENSYLQEQGDDTILIVRADGIETYGLSKPPAAPVLLLPKGFIENFKGKIINKELVAIGTVKKKGK